MKLKIEKLENLGYKKTLRVEQRLINWVGVNIEEEEEENKEEETN